MLISTSLFAQIPSYIPQNGLVGWWPFNGNANDESGNGNNGIVYNATLTFDRNGLNNNAYNFNGLSSYLEMIGNSTLHNLNDTMSLSYWLNYSSNAGSNIGFCLSKYSYFGAGSINGFSSSIGTYLESTIGNISGSVGLPSADSISKDVWHNVIWIITSS